MTPAYRIRLARQADLARLQEIERAAAILYPQGRIPDPEDTIAMDELERTHANALLWVATLEDRAVGFAASREHEGRLHLAVVAVHPEHGRRGVGTRLVKAVVQQARRRRLSGVTLTTFRDLPWNAPFYTKVGFRILNRSELNPMLRAILLQEENLGMTNRVAMLYAVPGTAPPSDP